MVLIGQVNPQIVAAINVHGPLRRRRVGRGRRPDPRRGPRPRARLRRRRRPASTRRSCSGLLDEESHPGHRHDRHRRGRARRTTSTPTPWPARSPRRCGAEKLVYLTDIEGLRRDVDDPASLIRQTDADELDALMADGTIAGGMIPKVESCVARRAQRGPARPHPRRPHRPRAAARDLHRRRDRHDGHGRTRIDGGSHERSHAFDTARAWTALPVHARVRPAAGDVRARPGHRAVGRRRASATSTSSAGSPSRRSATPTRWWPRRSPTQARTLLHVSATCSPTRSDARQAVMVNDLLVGGAGPPRPGVLLQLRRRGQRGCASSWPASSAAAAATSSSAPTAASTAARSPRSPPPGSRPSTSRSSRCPRASARRVGRPRRARGGDRPDVAAVLIEPVQGEGGVNPATAEYFQGIRALCDERGPADDGRRGADRLRPHGRVVRLPARRRACPTWSRWPRRWATASRSAPAGPARGGRGRSSRATTAARTAARRSPPRRSRRCSTRCAASTRRRSPRQQGGRAHGAARRRCRGVTSVRGAGAAARRRARPTASTPSRRTPTLLGRRAGHATPSPPRRCGFAPPITVIDAEIDEAVAMVGAVLAVGAAAPERDGAPLPRASTDLDARRAGDRCSTWPSGRSTSLGRPLDGPGRGADLREAVEPHPPLDGDGGRAARRPPGLHPRRGGRLRHPRAGRGRRPDHERLPRAAGRPRVRARRSSNAWPPSATVPVVNMLSDRAHPLQAPRRRAHDAQALGPLAGRTRGLRRATTTTSPGRWPRRRRCSACTCGWRARRLRRHRRRARAV